MKAAFQISALLVLLVSASSAYGQGTTNDRPNVTVATVKSQPAGDRGRYIGRVEAVSTVDLVARVEGFLEKRNFTEGGFVKTGDLLYQIEKGTYEANVASAKAELEGAQATLKNAQVNLQRQQVLLGQGDVPQSVVDSAQAEVGEDQSSVDQAKADLDTANINLSYTDIYSPIDGRISKTNIDVGNLVNSNSGTLATVTSVDPIYVSFYVGEKDLIRDREQGLIGENDSNLKVKVTLSDGTPYPIEGTITYVDTTVQEASDTIEMRATFANPKNVLIPMQFVNVTLVDATPQMVLVIPQAAVQLDAKGHFVYVVDADDKIERRDVTLGQQLASTWQVASGLKAGEKVVTVGLQRVSPGTVVTANEQQS